MESKKEEHIQKKDECNGKQQENTLFIKRVVALSSEYVLLHHAWQKAIVMCWLFDKYFILFFKNIKKMWSFTLGWTLLVHMSIVWSFPFWKTNQKFKKCINLLYSTVNAIFSIKSSLDRQNMHRQASNQLFIKMCHLWNLCGGSQSPNNNQNNTERRRYINWN